jgi:hypothetical protein
MKLRSTTDSCEIVVMKAPSDPVDLRCGGHALAPAEAEAPTENIESGFDGGTKLGKKYASEELGVEVRCTKPGDGSISVGEMLLEPKGPKPLPASDSAQV